MSSISWRMIELLSRLLESDDRDASLGDFAENGLSVFTALRDLIGLIARRQAALWRTWRPWLALLGVVIPGSLLLLNFSLYLTGTFDLYFWIIGNHRHFDPAMLDETGLTVTHGVAVMLRHSLLLAAWAWTAGFVLGSLSRRAILVNGLLLSGIVTVLTAVAVGTLPPPKPWLLLSVIGFLTASPLVCGVRFGLRRANLRTRPAVLLASTVLAITVLSIWAGGWWRGGPWNNRQLALSLFLCWPSAYIAMAAGRQDARQLDHGPRVGIAK